ncbi:uncharacterized protein LOC131078589 [Cryptomeria japonica]|uniref:uncharacterized protein LOC131078589 n=1 Tax=Cryptomeria japonica TaxID=3369 RepID=UPI0025AC36CF|nr:uncharacterized protein LOC131078589 [Cryptomeria japonica]
MVWERPLEGWWKVNFDGAFKGNSGPSGAGVIVRDWKGDIVALGAQKLDEGTNNIAEASVGLLAVRLSKKLGDNKIHLGGDSLIVIWAIISWIYNIIEELKSFDEFYISHIRRAGNAEANILSKWALSFDTIGKLRVEDFQQVIFEEEVGFCH